MEGSTSAKTWRQKGDWQIWKRAKAHRGEERVKQRWGRESTGSGISLMALNRPTNSWIAFGTLKSRGGNDSALFISSFQWAEDGWICVLSSCPTLCDPLDYSPPGASVHGIILTRAGMPSPFPGDLPGPRTEPGSPAGPALAGGFFTTEPPRKLWAEDRKGSKHPAVGEGSDEHQLGVTTESCTQERHPHCKEWGRTLTVNGKSQCWSSKGSWLSAQMLTDHHTSLHSPEQLVRGLFFCFSFLFYLWLLHTAWGLLVPWSGAELVPAAMEVWGLNHWTTRKVPKGIFFFKVCTHKDW